MNTFFLITRGRTGSTATIDELNKSHSLCALQEFFPIYEFDNIPDVSGIGKVYNILLPFVLWKRQDWLEKRSAEVKRAAALGYAARFENVIRDQNQ